MIPARAGIVVPKAAKGINLRRHGRVRMRGCACCRGEVVDISASGMRVAGRGRPPPEGSHLQVVVEGESGPVGLPAKVAWSRRRGWFGSEMGLEFEELTLEQRRAVMFLVRAAVSAEILRPDEEPAD